MLRKSEISYTNSVMSIGILWLKRTMLLKLCLAIFWTRQFTVRWTESLIELTQFRFVLDSIWWKNLSWSCKSLWVKSDILLAWLTLLSVSHSFRFISLSALEARWICRLHCLQMLIFFTALCCYSHIGSWLITDLWFISCRVNCAICWHVWISVIFLLIMLLNLGLILFCLLKLLHLLLVCLLVTFILRLKKIYSFWSSHFVP